MPIDNRSIASYPKGDLFIGKKMENECSHKRNNDGSNVVIRSPSKSESNMLEIFHTNNNIAKRGLIKSTSPSIKNKFRIVSPARKGRSGLRSPEKRALDDLDRSAKKRALRKRSDYSNLLKNNAYSDDEIDDPLEKQELYIAEKIIRESKQSVKSKTSDENYETFYANHIQMEEDVSEMPTRRYSRKKRISTALSKKENMNLSDEERNNFESISSSSFSSSEAETDDLIDAFEDDEEYKESNNTKKSKNKELSKVEHDLSSDEDSFIEVRDQNIPASGDIEVTPKRKVGRPSKAEKVIGRIKNIFQFDDDTELSPKKTGRRSISQESPLRESDRLNAFVSKDSKDKNRKVPIISGIKNKQVKNQEKNVDVSFRPLEIPSFDQDGEVNDKQFIEKYLNGRDPRNASRGRLIDDRVLFLEGAEGYFEQHAGRPKFSYNSISSLAPNLTSDAIGPLTELADQFMVEEREILQSLYRASYGQWCYELASGFNINFYGIGSKISVLSDLVESFLPEWYENHMHEEQVPEILVVNGYNSAVKFKNILNEVISVLVPIEEQKSENLKIPKLISESVPYVIEYLRRQRTPERGIVAPKIVLVINNIDGQSFRSDKIQGLLSMISSVPEVWLISSTDHINVSLLWDSSKLKNFNFIWHNIPTYNLYVAEMQSKDILNVGVSKKFVGNKGAQYVLSSLTSNARKLYKVLLQLQLRKIENSCKNKAKLQTLRGNLKMGVALKDLYNACLEEFITSNETNFRTLLGEFIEHEMCKIAKDSTGTEILYVNFAYHELESLVNEELS